MHFTTFLHVMTTFLQSTPPATVNPTGPTPATLPATPPGPPTLLVPNTAKSCLQQAAPQPLSPCATGARRREDFGLHSLRMCVCGCKVSPRVPPTFSNPPSPPSFLHIPSNFLQTTSFLQPSPPPPLRNCRILLFIIDKCFTAQCFNPILNEPTIVLVFIVCPLAARTCLLPITDGAVCWSSKSEAESSSVSPWPPQPVPLPSMISMVIVGLQNGTTNPRTWQALHHPRFPRLHQGYLDQ